VSTSVTTPQLTRDDLRSPRWIAAHVGIAVLAVTFVLLGRWQWDVGHKVLPLTPAQLTAWRTPEPVASVLTADGMDGSRAGQAVEVTGTYDASRQLLVPGRLLNGHPGYDLIAPLVTAPGQAITVNRGWLPVPGSASGAATDSAVPPAIPAPPSGRITVTGWAAQSESATGSVNQNGIVQTRAPNAKIGAHEIAVISAAQLVNLWPYHLPNGYVSATDAASTSGGLTAITAPLPPHGTSWDLLNIGYAFQWCFFALVTLTWYALYWRRELHVSDADDPDPAPDSAPNPALGSAPALGSDPDSAPAPDSAPGRAPDTMP
jgi:cytochrome oxidase assembly protein ShyY1